MKKILALSLFAMAALVSQAWAEACKADGQQLWCQIGGGCYRYTTEYSGVGDTPASYVCRPSDPGEAAKFPSDLPVCTCAQLLSGCQEIGQPYTGVSESVNSAANNWGNGQNCASNGGTKYGSGNESCGFYCKWDSGCKEIKTDISGTNGTAVATCTEAIANCDKDAARYDNSSCTGTPVGGSVGGGELGFCDWGTCVYDPASDYSCLEGGCFKIANDTQLADCPSVLTSKSQCPLSSLPKADQGGTPTLKFTPASQALIVAPYGRSLHISSVRDATVSLYDMSGAKVYSGKVRAGNSVFSLEKVGSGSYYAVVQSGSDAKKVPVILK